MKEELEMLKKAYNLLRNLFDMGYSYPSSIETLEGLARDIETLKSRCDLDFSKDTPEDPLEEDEPPFDLPF